MNTYTHKNTHLLRVAQVEAIMIFFLKTRFFLNYVQTLYDIANPLYDIIGMYLIIKYFFVPVTSNTITECEFYITDKLQ